MTTLRYFEIKQNRRKDKVICMNSAFYIQEF